MKKGFSLDGEIREGDRFEIAFDEPFFAHGHGLFETIRVHRGKPCFLVPHVERMRGTALELGMDFPWDEPGLRAAIAELLAALGIENARVKLHLLGRKDGRSSMLVSAEEIPPLPREFPTIAVDRVAPQFRQRGMAGLKTMNYLVNRLAETEARARGFDEGIFVLGDDTVTEGTRSTVFAVLDGELWTPPLDLPILPGVTRLVFLRIAEERGIAVREERFGFDRLAAADEAFLVGSVSTFMPIRRAGEATLRAAPGPVGSALAERYLELVDGPAELV
ncbi:MAG: aminotransferase class IV [Planctomycetota bacterium]